MTYVTRFQPAVKEAGEPYAGRWREAVELRNLKAYRRNGCAGFKSTTPSRWTAYFANGPHASADFKRGEQGAAQDREPL
jgi:hypothetical protein